MSVVSSWGFFLAAKDQLLMIPCCLLLCNDPVETYLSLIASTGVSVIALEQSKHLCEVKHDELPEKISQTAFVKMQARKLEQLQLSFTMFGLAPFPMSAYEPDMRRLFRITKFKSLTFGCEKLFHSNQEKRAMAAPRPSPLLRPAWLGCFSDPLPLHVPCNQASCSQWLVSFTAEDLKTLW